jgi:TonB family protein
MPHALLLSPDDQAVSAITAVLEELSVTCERPLDGVSAAQKINSQSFDLVLVDCENLPAAKLIFDVCRRGKNGNNPVPIAIVDGRAGLPTAFRLGAELILTKPVAKDQARTTIRSAVGRVKKDAPTNDSAAAQGSDASASSQLTSSSEPTPGFTAATASTGVTATIAATITSPAMHAPMMGASAAATTGAAAAVAPATSASKPATHPEPKQSLGSSLGSLGSSPEVHVMESAAPGALASKPKLPLSDDPVLAELERTELEASDQAESKAAETSKAEPQPDVAKSTPERTATTSNSNAPTFLSYQQKRQRGPLVALFVLFLATAGFYAAWTYQPGFQAIVQPQIDRALHLAGLPTLAAPVTSSAKPSIPTTVSTSAPAAAVPGAAPVSSSSSIDTTNMPPAAPDAPTTAATGSATGSSSASAAAGGTTPALPIVTSAAPATPSAPAAKTTTTSTPVATKSDASKTVVAKSGNTKAVDTKVSDKDAKFSAKSSEKLSDKSGAKSSDKNDTAAPVAVSDTPLPGEASAIILSSKGAEKRLSHSVPPKYPAGEKPADAQGTVVLKEVVDENGKVAGVRLVEGDPALANAAIAAVKQWRYRPYERDGKTQPFQTVVIIDFQRP